MTMSTSKTLRSLATLSVMGGALAFASAASAGDCSSKKAMQTQASTQQTQVLASSTTLSPSYTFEQTQAAPVILAGDYSKKSYSKAKSNIVETAMATESLSTLVAAVKAADLVGTLSGDGPFTVFAPTNAAFAGLPAGTVDTLLMPENKGQLTTVLTSHVVSGKFKAKNIVALAKENGGSVQIPTVGGAMLTAILSGDTLYVKDEQGGLASVALADVKTSNGVVHVVDKVLLPGSTS